MKPPRRITWTWRAAGPTGAVGDHVVLCSPSQVAMTIPGRPPVRRPGEAPYTIESLGRNANGDRFYRVVANDRLRDAVLAAVTANELLFAVRTASHEFDAPMTVPYETVTLNAEID